jgi:alkylated DNA repair dioxygenase AlkB
MAEFLIQTKNSLLTVKKFKDIELITDCVSDISDKLLKNPQIIVYGKVCYQHRSIGFFSNDSIGYHYSNQLAKSQPLTDNLQNLLNQVNGLYQTDFNGILINKYENGSDYISAHSDDEKDLSDIGVVSLSYGETRKFRIRDKITKKIVKDIPLIEGEIVRMGGKFQQEFTHEIPVEKKINGIRYSFTFRKHNT